MYYIAFAYSFRARTLSLYVATRRSTSTARLFFFWNGTSSRHYLESAWGSEKFVYVQHLFVSVFCISVYLLCYVRTYILNLFIWNSARNRTELIRISRNSTKNFFLQISLRVSRRLVHSSPIQYWNVIYSNTISNDFMLWVDCCNVRRTLLMVVYSWSKSAEVLRERALQIRHHKCDQQRRETQSDLSVPAIRNAVATNIIHVIFFYLYLYKSILNWVRLNENVFLNFWYCFRRHSQQQKPTEMWLGENVCVR